MLNIRDQRRIACLGFILLGTLTAVLAGADDHVAREGHRERKRDGLKHEQELCVAPVTDATYRETCGSCHFAYQPGLLPARSWEGIMARLEDHFGESVDLEPDAKAAISGYLQTNAAENSSEECSGKIMRSLKGAIPGRVTEVPHIIRKHHEVSPDILKRKSIGSLSNCAACHKTAEQGVYDDDQVIIPQ
jgi:hypothetical protein